MQMATGTGKSLVMADLLADLSPSGKACVIVPKLDLMEQMAKLLENALPSVFISRVGTGWRANLTADVFVCVRNSAWQLENVSFDLLLLDEAHHYEPSLHSDCTNHSGPYLRQVFSLKADKRVFFSATLVRNSPDFDFSLRPAIEAGVIQDYSILVPVVSEGDPRPSLVEIIQNLPLSRKILAFCNTVCEAKRFTKLLIDAGIPAGHYNADTKQSRRQQILSSFALNEAGGGIRVLVTVDVLSEGVDLPWADTCLFVAPRRGIRFRQCVGRVLRRETGKLDALVIAPPIVANPASGNLTEDRELRRLLQDLASVDPVFRRSLGEKKLGQTLPLAIKAGGLPGVTVEDVLEQAAELLDLRVLPSVLKLFQTTWESWYDRLRQYKEEHGNVLVSRKYKTADGYSLGTWVNTQRVAKARGELAAERVALLDEQGFVWSLRRRVQSWESWYDRLRQYKEEHGNLLVPQKYTTADGYSLGMWVRTQREAKSRCKLAAKRVALLDEQGFVWSLRRRVQSWEGWYDRLRQYQEEHGNVWVHYNYKTADGYSLGTWVNTQRTAKARGKLDAERVALLDEQGFVWSCARVQSWESWYDTLRQYKEEHGNVQVRHKYKTADGYSLGMWVRRQRKAKSICKLPAKRVALLDEQGFVWSCRRVQSWESWYNRLRQYKEEHGNVLVPHKYKTADGYSLGTWVTTQRGANARGELAAERVALLDEQGFVWSVRGKRSDVPYQ